MDGLIDGWIDGWMDRWMDGKAVLRIAYYDKKKLQKNAAFLH